MKLNYYKQKIKGTGIYQSQNQQTHLPGVRSGQTQFLQPNNQQFGLGQTQNNQNLYDNQTSANIQQFKTQKFLSPATTTTATSILSPSQQSLQPSSECSIHFSGKHDAIYIYLTRLLAPIWDLKLLTELTTNTNLSNDHLADNSMASLALNESCLFAIFTEIDIQWYLNKLNELRHFIDLNFPQLKTLQHSYLNGSLFGLSVTQNVSTGILNARQMNEQMPNLGNTNKFYFYFSH